MEENKYPIQVSLWYGIHFEKASKLFLLSAIEHNMSQDRITVILNTKKQLNRFVDILNIDLNKGILPFVVRPTDVLNEHFMFPVNHDREKRHS